MYEVLPPLAQQAGECQRLIPVGISVDATSGVLSGTPRNNISCPMIVEASNTAGDSRRCHRTGDRKTAFAGGLLHKGALLC